MSPTVRVAGVVVTLEGAKFNSLEEQEQFNGYIQNHPDYKSMYTLPLINGAQPITFKFNASLEYYKKYVRQCYEGVIRERSV